jgi:hypothetical protein
MARASDVVYTCKSCNTIFFTLEAVNEHKAMTGHAYYSKREKEETNHKR